MTNQNLDQVNLVDKNDQIIGVMDKVEAHRGDAQLHQAISLFLFYKKADGSLKLLLQQRSEKKIVGALQWANTLCANVRPGESHKECLFRRMREELGVVWNNNWTLEEIDIFYYQVKCNEEFSEHEMDHVFVSVLDKENFENFKLNINPDEVNNTVWLDWSGVKKENLGERIAAPWFEIFLENKELISKIEEKI